MKQPLILTAAERTACANALAVRERGYYALAFKDNITWSHGLVRRAETYLAVVHARAHVLARLRRPQRSTNERGQMVVVKHPELHSEVLALTIQGHELLLALIKSAHGSHAAAQILADVAFGPDLNPEPAPASE